MVVDQLRGLGHDVRVVTHDAKNPPPGVATIEGDFAKGDLPAAAFTGVRRASLFPAQGGVEGFLNQAKRSKVEHLVVLSSLAAAQEHERDRDSPSAIHHLAIEKSVEDSGIPATFLRPGNFANNLLFWAHSIRTGEVVYGPYATSSQTTLHEADIAATAVVALTQERHQGKTYPMTGPEALTRIEQLGVIGAATGKQLRFQEVPPEAFEKEMGKYMPPPIIKMLLSYCSETVAKPDAVLPTVEVLPGRKARPLSEWAADHAADFSASAH